MATKISDVMIMSAIAISVFLGMMTFMGELETNYAITLPDNSSDNIEEIFEDMNKTSTDLQGSLTGDQSWLETSFNIVFRLPQTVTGTINTMANSAGKLLSVATGEDMQLPIPGWILGLIFMIIAIVIITTIFYVIIGRGF